MSILNLNLLTKLDVYNKTITVTDVTDWVAQGLDNEEIYVALEIKTPIGLLYKNASYTTPITSPDLYFGHLSTTKTLPVDSKGKLLQGVYTVTGNVYYNVNGSLQATTFTQNITYTQPCVTIDVTHDCYCANFSSTDTTLYGASEEISYSQIIRYPAAVDEADTTVGTHAFTESRLASGYYTVSVSTVRDYSYGTHFIVEDTISGSVIHDVDCSQFCEIKCSFDKLYANWKDLSGTSPVEAERIWKTIQKATVLMTLISVSQKCGNIENVDTYISQLKTLLGDCDCGCDDCASESEWLEGICGGAVAPSAHDYLFTSCNNLIDVTTNTIGDTTTVDICLNETLLTTYINEEFTALTNIFIDTVNNINIFDGVNAGCLNPAIEGGGTTPQKLQVIVDVICALLNLDFTCITNSTDIQDQFQALIDAVCANTAAVTTTATDDIATCVQGTSVDINVLANDGVFSFPITLSIPTNPANGTVTILSNNYIQYEPTDSNFVGVDTFQYEITDSSGHSSTATVTVTVTPEATPCPVFTPSFLANVLTTGGNVMVTMQNTTNLNGANGNWLQFDVTYKDFVGNIISQQSTGQLLDFINPVSVSTPYVAGMASVDILLSVSSLRLTPPEGYCPLKKTSVSGYSIPVPVNVPPVANPDTYTVQYETLLVISNPAQGVLNNDVNYDSATLTVTAGTFTTTESGSITIYADGTFAYTPAALFVGTDTYTYEMTDGVNPAVYGDIYFNVLPEVVNPTPVTNDFTINIGLATTSTPLTIPLNIDTAGYTYTIQIVTAPTEGTLTTYGVGDKLYTRVTAGAFTDTIQYTVTTFGGALVSNTSTITIISA